MSSFLLIVSSAEDHEVNTGFYLRETLALKSALIEGRHDVAVATPNGAPPHPDPLYGGRGFYVDSADLRFLASTVLPGANTGRVSARLSPQTALDLELVSARQVRQQLTTVGGRGDVVLSAIRSAAELALSDGRVFSETMEEQCADTGEVVQSVMARITSRIEAAAADDCVEFAGDSSFAHPLDLQTVTDDQLRGYDALIGGGGHGALIDFVGNSGIERALAAMRVRGASISALGHGCAILLSAPMKASGNWGFDGYRMTAPSDAEVDQICSGLGVPWSIESALKAAGGVFDTTSKAWEPRFVVDNNLSTAVNSLAAEALTKSLLSAN